MAVADIISEYHANNKKATPDEEKKDIRTTIEFFEAKYKGPYQSTLMLKENKNDEELRDESEWKYMIQRLND